MFILEIEQDRYNKTRFAFDDVDKAIEMMLAAKASAAQTTTITLKCVVEIQGEEDDND